MAVTLTPGDVALAIRVATDADQVPEPAAALLGWLIPAATAMVVDYAPDAPDSVHNIGLIRLVGWMYDSDPTESVTSNPLLVSGAGSMLSRWRVHRAGLVLGAQPGDTPTPTPTPGGNVPTPPADGNYILTSENGSLEWVQFPKP